MKRILAIWIILATFVGCNQSTENKTPTEESVKPEINNPNVKELTNSGRPPFIGELKEDLDNLGLDGTIPVEVLGVSAPQDLYKMQNKMGRFLAQYPNTPRPESIKDLDIDTISSFPYIGLSKEDWVNFKRMMTEVAYGKLTLGSLDFVMEGENFIIKPQSENLQPWWNVTVDLAGNTLTVMDQVLPYVGTKSDDAPTNGFGEWKWHEWSIDEKISVDPTKPDLLTVKNLKFQIGQVTRTGKTVLFLTLQEYDKGEQKQNYVVPVWF